MIELFVDTSLSYIRIAIIKESKLLDCINEKCEKNMSSLFVQRVKEIFEKNDLELKNVDKIYTVTGPGSFTGIRVGMTFSKVLAFALNKKITPISELQVLASTDVETSLVAPLIDARRGFVYAGVYDKNLNNINEDEYMLLDKFITEKKDVTYVSYKSFEHICTKIPEIDFINIINKNKDTAQINHQLLVPNYLKLTEAEENLRKKQECDC